MVSWIEAPRPKGDPTVPMLGASTMGRTSVAVLPPEEEGAVLEDVVSVGSVGSLSGTWVDGPNASGLDVTLAPLSSAIIPFSHSVLHVDVLCALHPFFVHKLDSGPMRLMTIAHALNYRVASCLEGWSQVGYSGWTVP